MPVKRQTLQLAAALCAFLCVGFAGWHAGSSHAEATLRVTFLDVGQGDSAVIETPGGRVVLVDCGGRQEPAGADMGRMAVEPYLRSRGVRKIDAIILTHPHLDHIGGADSLLRDFPTDLVIDNGEPTVPPAEERILADAAERHVAHRIAVRGQSLDLGDGVRADILAPTPEETQADHPNNASIVIRLTYGRRRFLLMGDAEKAEESDLVESRLPLDCDVLKVGHHGSKTSTLPGFLKVSHPEDAIISVGAENRYGHPSQEVVQRLQQSGAHVIRTDVAGAVQCETDGYMLKISTMRKHSVQ